MTEYQVIFRSANGKDGAMQDYCREPLTAVDDNAAAHWALAQADALRYRIRCDVEARVEFWGERGEDGAWIAPRKFMATDKPSRCGVAS